jgi:RNA polymerase-interacting CarD/CdnL/TRCF family regulator
MSTLGSDENFAHDSGSSRQGTLTTGNKAVYPGQGPCRVDRVIQRVVDARVVMFYHLIMLDDDQRGDLFVPVEKARAIGVRSLMKKSEVPEILAHLRKTAAPVDNWKQRASDNLQRFKSGSPYDLADVVVSLTELGDTKSLTLGQAGALVRARRLLICEISEVMGETKSSVEQQVDCALSEREKMN